MRKLLTAALLTLIAVLPAYAQVSGGSITGTVTDEQKAVLPGCDRDHSRFGPHADCGDG